MEQVRVFKTKDGTLFNDRIAAENHELMINIRGIIQSHVKGQSFTPTEIATILSKEQDNMFATIGKYRKTMAGIKSNAGRIG
jgi:hypothetical protein